MVDNGPLLGTRGEWGGGPAFDTFSPGKAGSINKLCDEGAFEKKIHQQQLHYNVGPCVAKSVTLASVEIPSKKVHNIGHNEFSALHSYCEKNAVSGGKKT